MHLEDEVLPISALQHLLFCERQCALIHVERLWAENRLTVEGRLFHARVHDEDDRTRAGVRVTHGLRLASQRLGLYGVADVVEFSDRGAAFPIEHKLGRPKAHDADVVQLCAQALCLEEMTTHPVLEGALFYGRSRRRLRVVFDDTLRRCTERAATRLHELIRTAVTPIARREPKCDRCSLLNLCLPDAHRTGGTAARYLESGIAELLAQSLDKADGP